MSAVVKTWTNRDNSQIGMQSSWSSQDGINARLMDPSKASGNVSTTRPAYENSNDPDRKTND